MAKRRKVESSPPIKVIEIESRKFLDLEWPADQEVEGAIVRFTIRAKTAAEASSLADAAEAWALNKGAYAVGAPVKIVSAERPVRMEIPDAVRDDPTAPGAERHLVAEYLRQFSAPAGLTVEAALKMMGVAS